MLSSIATQEPLPFVPATVMTLYDGLRRPSVSSTATNRSSRRSMRFGWTLSNQASQRSSVNPRRGVVTRNESRGSGQRGPRRKLGEQRRDLVARMPAIEDHVDGALLEQELRALEALGQRLARRLLDDARARETDQRAGLGDVDVAEQREARRDAARRRVRHHGDVRQLRGRELRERRARLRHLQQRVQPFLHARAAARRKTDERPTVLHAVCDSAHEPLADDRAHRARDETKLERRGDDRHALQRPGHDDERVALVGVALDLVQPLAIALRVLEAQRIERLEIRRELVPRLGVEEHFEALARADPQVMAALRANVQVAIELGAIELCGAAGALDPEPFGHRVLALLGADPGWHQLIEPAHTTAMDGGSAANAGCNLRSRLPDTPGIIAERPKSALRLVLVAWQLELERVQHLDERQALGRRRHAGFAAIAAIEDQSRVSRRELAAAHGDQSSDEVADHVLQESVGRELERHER